MLTKEYITELKNKGNGDIGYLIEKQQDNKSIIFILENLGALPINFDGSFLAVLLSHQNANVRY